MDSETRTAPGGTVPPCHRSPALAACAHVRHGFFGRPGGVPGGLYGGLNCGLGSNDDPNRVAANRTRAALALGVAPERLVSLYQVHSPDAVVVTRPWTRTDAPRADAMVTREPGLALGILTADCAPVLLADDRARVIGAAHAGWKGALSGVIESAIRVMEEMGAERSRIRAAVGPCISQANYEVGPEFRDRFLEADGGNGRFFVVSADGKRWHFDLPGYALARLAAAGVREACAAGLCTYGDEAAYFSFRRTVHRNEPDYGRNLSAIALTGNSPAK